MIKPKTKLIGVKCSESAFVAVEKIANELEISNGEVLRRALTYYLDELQRQEREVKGATENET